MESHIISDPPTEARDSALGRYMDAWSRLETMIMLATRDILGIESEAAHVIWSALQTYQKIKVLDAAAKLRFHKRGRERVAKICESLIHRNTRRNYIVHGTWSHRIEFGVGDRLVSEWRRVYDHVDPDMPKGDDGSNLTIPALDTTTGHVEEMVLALCSLIEDIPSLLARPQTPAE